jgi:FkbM family methyltransferase
LLDAHWLPHVNGRSVCVQAGGNCGLYPLRLAAYFQQVYTFEPDAANFACMALNCALPNVFKFQACLSDACGSVDLERDPQNAGAHFVKGVGIIPSLRLDDLKLDACDLIALDVEGMELAALKGAADTVTKFHPVIVVEEKGHGARYGVSAADLSQWLEERGYRLASRCRRDQIWT